MRHPETLGASQEDDRGAGGERAGGRRGRAVVRRKRGRALLSRTWTRTTSALASSDAADPPGGQCHHVGPIARALLPRTSPARPPHAAARGRRVHEGDVVGLFCYGRGRQARCRRRTQLIPPTGDADSAAPSPPHGPRTPSCRLLAMHRAFLSDAHSPRTTNVSSPATSSD